METKTIIGLLAGILTAASTLPQIFKILKEKKVKAVSPVMYFVLLAGNSLWCWYGIMLGELPIIITNAFSAVCDVVMLALNYYYKNRT